MKNAIHGKRMENLRNRIYVKTCKQWKRLFKMYIKTKIYVAQNIWQKFSCDMKNTKLHESFNKPAYIGMCILELSKVLMYEFLYDYF